LDLVISAVFLTSSNDILICQNPDYKSRIKNH
jgi:hypothetical protein